jgi:uncharacterized membrane protein
VNAGRKGFGRVVLSATGAVTALVFWWLSLVPSQLPRSWWMQAVISAVIAAIDGLGLFAGWLARMAGHRLGYRPPAPAARRRSRAVFIVVASVGSIAGVVLWHLW